MNPFIKIKSQYYVRQDAVVSSGISRNTLHQRSRRNKEKFGIIYDPSNKNCLLHQFDLMKQDEQDLIIKHFNGTPEQWLAMEPIRNMIIPVPGAEDFYLSYRYDLNGKQTPLTHEMIDKYSRNAQIMEMLKRAWSDKKAIKKSFGMQLDGFVEQVIKVIIADNYDLPHSYPRLMSRPESPFKRYLNESFAGLISKSIGIKRAIKVENEECEAVLLQLIAHPNQYNDTWVCYYYNDWAKKNGYKEITPRTVNHWRLKKESEIMMQREGNAAFNEKYIRQVKGIKPTAPLYLVESDDYNVNYYFEDQETKNRLARYVSYIVADSATGLILGYSYRPAKSPVFEMVQLAWLNAMYYIRELTGDWYLPFEVKADHWQKTNAFPYFESIGKFIPPAHGNKHRGYLEPLFGSSHAKHAEKLAAHNTLNYNGNNVTAANWGVNVEVLNKGAAHRPLVGYEADTQLEKFFHYMRTMPAITRENMNAPSREQLFLDKWNALPDAEKRPITDEQFLMTFGFKHNPDRPLTITNRGVEPEINGINYSFDMPDYVSNIDWIGAKVNVIYDPNDMSRVLVTDGQKIRFIAQNAVRSERALHDTRKNSRTVLNAILSEKKDQVAAMAGKAAQRERFFVPDAESVMLGAFQPKELKNETEDYYLQQASGQDFENLPRKSVFDNI